MPELEPQNREDARPTLIGTENQIAWAEEIRATVAAEFDRVRAALASRIDGQTERGREDIRAILRILEEKRSAVMTKREAGYFIHDWQEVTDQVRKMIMQDPRYVAIQVYRTRPE